MLFELLRGEKKKFKSKSKVNILLGATSTMKFRNSFWTFEREKRRKTKKKRSVPKFLHSFFLSNEIYFVRISSEKNDRNEFSKDTVWIDIYNKSIVIKKKKISMNLVVNKEGNRIVCNQIPIMFELWLWVRFICLLL